MFNSPWLYRLFHRRTIKRLKGEHKADVTIIGGGISGILTAYYLLTETDRDVVLLEADRMAEGATGHNAGVVTSAVERPIVEMMKEYGRDKTVEGIRELENGWNLFDDLRATVKPSTPIYDTEEKAGYVLDPCLLSILADQHALEGTGLMEEHIKVAKHVLSDPRLQPFTHLVTGAEHGEILSEMQTTRLEYVASGRIRAACTNSASLCEDILTYCQRSFPTRFRSYEHSRVTEVSFVGGKHEIKGASFRLVANELVVCTNGYAPEFLRPVELHITPGILDRMHAYVGYMAGYYESEAPTSAHVYIFDDPATWLPYYYLTTRPSGERGQHRKSLFCIGGPERKLGPKEKYDHHDLFPDEISKSIRTFLHTHSRTLSPGSRPYHHEWHGLMCYTDSRTRWVGRDHVAGNLYWNLGCNGIGLLPAFSGAQRIARLINGEHIVPSIFDVPLK